MYEINFFTSFQESYVQRSRNSLSKHEKVFQIISIVLSFEQSIEFFTFIFQCFCLNFKLTFTIFKAFMNDFQNNFRRTRHDGGFMFYIAIDYMHKTNIKVAASNNINIKMHHLFFKRADSFCLHDHCKAKNLSGLGTNLLLNNVQIILVKITIKLVLICVPKVPFLVFNKQKKEIQNLILRFCFYFNTKNEIQAIGY